MATEDPLQSSGAVLLVGLTIFGVARKQERSRVVYAPQSLRSIAYGYYATFLAMFR